MIMSDEVKQALKSRLDKARGEYNNKVLAKHNDPTQKQSAVAAWSGDRLLVRGTDGTVTAKNVITNGAIGLGDPVAVRGNTANEMPRVKREVKADPKAAVKIKVGYVYSQEVGGSTGLFCAASPPGGGQNQPVPANLPSRWYPVPPGSPPITVTIRYGAVTSVGWVSGTITGATPEPGIATITSSDYVESFFDDYSGEEQTIDGFNGVCAPGSYKLSLGGTFFAIDNANASYVAAVNPAIFQRVSQSVTLETSQPLNPFPPGSTLPTPTTPPENPGDPSSPDPSNSLEFWYNCDRADAPIQLKSFAANQPLEDKPYIYHYSANVSYVVLKYGNAGNDGGTSGDWCKMSLFRVAGRTDLSFSETVYQWSTEVSLANQLQALKSPFYAVLASKNKAEDIDLDDLIADGDLEPKFRCQTHRNLTNLKRRSTSVFLIDPATNTALGTLAGEDFYELPLVDDLIAEEQITAIARFFELKANPAYTSSGEDCLTNPAYKLIEKPRGKIKNVKIKGLGSADTTIKILTFNCGQV